MCTGWIVARLVTLESGLILGRLIDVVSRINEF